MTMAQTTKTNNSYLADKVALRVAHLPDREVLRVMDCYAGSGVVWSAVKKLTGRRIAVLPIDISADVDGFHLAGDNKQYLETMDLSRFDVIDLDAYGVPYDQLKIVLDRGFHGTVFVTFIQSVFGTVRGAGNTSANGWRFAVLRLSGIAIMPGSITSGSLSSGAARCNADCNSQPAGTFADRA